MYRIFICKQYLKHIETMITSSTVTWNAYFGKRNSTAIFVWRKLRFQSCFPFHKSLLHLRLLSCFWAQAKHLETWKTWTPSDAFFCLPKWAMKTSTGPWRMIFLIKCEWCAFKFFGGSRTSCRYLAMFPEIFWRFPEHHSNLGSLWCNMFSFTCLRYINQSIHHLRGESLFWWI